MTEPVTDADLDRWEASAAPLADLAFWQGVVVRLVAAVRQRDANVRAMTAALERDR